MDLLYKGLGLSHTNNNSNSAAAPAGGGSSNNSNANHQSAHRDSTSSSEGSTRDHMTGSDLTSASSSTTSKPIPIPGSSGKSQSTSYTSTSPPLPASSSRVRSPPSHLTPISTSPKNVTSPPTSSSSNYKTPHGFTSSPAPLLPLSTIAPAPAVPLTAPALAAQTTAAAAASPSSTSDTSPRHKRASTTTNKRPSSHFPFTFFGFGGGSHSEDKAGRKYSTERDSLDRISEDVKGLGIESEELTPKAAVSPKTKEEPPLSPISDTTSLSGPERFKNSARIVHAFGTSGLAPLAPLSQKKGEDRSIIPVMISWTGGGKTVHITGTFNNWKQKIRLTKSKSDFTTVIDMPAGQTHRFKFIVDEEWKCSEDLPMATDSEGNLVNYLEVFDEYGLNIGDGLDGLATDDTAPTPVPLSESPPSTYTSKIPSYLSWHLESHQPPYPGGYAPEPPPLPNEPPPPVLPPHLEKVLLNTPSLGGLRDDNTVLPLPQPVTINHLYACSIRDGVMALACTTRYRHKYVTTVLYKPVHLPQ